MIEHIAQLIDIILHLNVYLGQIIDTFGPWTYAILFLVIFCETGLVVTPFLPGDSLLFAAGSLTSISSLDPHLLVPCLIAAALLGDTSNYWIGRIFGKTLFTKESRWLKPKYIHKTHAFYEKYGCKTIIIARFVPIVRTFAPFVAGLGDMGYRKFIVFSLIGAVLWVGGLVYLGSWFGNVPFVKNNFSIVILAIIFLSILPAVIELLKLKFCKQDAQV